MYFFPTVQRAYVLALHENVYTVQHTIQLVTKKRLSIATFTLTVIHHPHTSHPTQIAHHPIIPAPYWSLPSRHLNYLNFLVLSQEHGRRPSMNLEEECMSTVCWSLMHPRDDICLKNHTLGSSKDFGAKILLLTQRTCVRARASWF